MLRVTDVNKAATTMWDFDSTTLGYFFSSLLWVVLAGRESKNVCWGGAEPEGMHPQTRETSKLCRDE
jgi:hypothetical protein